jgi:hypothetical protein
MSKTSWGSQNGKRVHTLLDVLRRLGAPIDRHAEAAVNEEKDRDPEATTEDIVIRLSLAPPGMVQQAVVIAKEEASTDILKDRYLQATAELRETRRAAVRLSQTAAAVAKK